MLPRRLLPWLFALTLLFGQAAAFAHALGHLQTDAAPSDAACEVCVAQANLGAAAPAPVFVLPVAAGEITAYPASTPALGPVRRSHAHARAPPATP